MSNERDRDGRTALHHAAFANDVDRLKELLRSGSDPDDADRRGYTPLHFAAQEGAVEATCVLLDAGANVDSIDVYGNTPLWTATFNSRGQGELIKLLRSRGADPCHVNKSGNSPVSLARLIGNYDVAQFFADLDEA
jgi:uncharacterized protein